MALLVLCVSVASLAGSAGLFSCEKPVVEPPVVEPEDTIPTVVIPFDINTIMDDYSDVASADKIYQWASHNVHYTSIFFDVQN